MPMDEVYKNFHATTRKVLNKGNQYNLKIYKGTEKDINDFYETMIETAKREGIIQASIDYYKAFYEIFHKSGMSDLYIAKVNIDDLKKLFKQNIEETMNKETKNEVQEKEKQDKLTKLNKQLEEINSISEKELTLASIITVKYKDKVWTIHGGNHSKLMSLNANYLIYYEIIKDANKEGYKVVDLFGTCGIANPDPSNPIYGIHNFKKRLGCEYTEFIGEFDLIINNIMYKLYKIYQNRRNKKARKKIKST
jgi:peptidoglycan pentaglycine glycine transferase (the first glycine)